MESSGNLGEISSAIGNFLLTSIPLSRGSPFFPHAKPLSVELYSPCSKISPAKGHLSLTSVFWLSTVLGSV